MFGSLTDLREVSSLDPRSFENPKVKDPRQDKRTDTVQFDKYSYASEPHASYLTKPRTRVAFHRSLLINRRICISSINVEIRVVESFSA